MGVRFYCGVGEKRWNYHPIEPGRYACVSPVKGKSARTKTKTPVYIPPGVEVLQDSGAFSDNRSGRLTFAAALQRQIAHAEQYGYADKITHRASYDLLIDEVWEGGNRHKRRWTVEAAEDAVNETVAAAEYLAQHRNSLGLVLSAQGVDAAQYLGCVQRITPLLDPKRDVLGLGGWCITGKMPTAMLGVFRETIRLVIPYASMHGVKRVHIFGVIFPFALGELLWMCNQHGIALSTDSTGPTLQPVLNRWGYGDWIDKGYQRPPSTDLIGAERARHVAMTIDWLSRLETTAYYQAPLTNTAERITKDEPLQLALL
jgi:hypothetical protein